MGYIYILTSPSGKSYIGQTIRPIQKRLEEHQKERSRCVAIYNAIKYHGWENFEKDWYECPDEDLNFDEELLIREMETLSPNGYNLLEGGGSNGKPCEETVRRMSEAQLGKIHTEESKQKMSEAKKGDKHPMYGKTGEKSHSYGKTHTEETIRKISEAQKGEKCFWYGKTHSDESKQKVGDKNRGKTRSKETKQKHSDSTKGGKHHRSKRVYQYDLGGAFINSFGSTGEAVREMDKGDSSTICRCANGRIKTAYGFKWSYTKY